MGPSVRVDSGTSTQVHLHSFGAELLGSFTVHRSSWLLYGILFVLLARWFFSSFTRRNKLPPGPRGLPIIGNLHQLSETAWFPFTEWKKLYGPIMYLNLAGQNVIVLNTLEVAGDLLDRRASNYSSRPHFEVSRNMLTEGLFFVFQSHTDLWRRMRRAAHESLHRGLVQDYHPIQNLEAAIMLKDMLETPKNWASHMRRTVGSTVLSVTYGTPPLKDASDPAMADIFDFTKRIVEAGYVDGYLVEFFPWLAYLPKWIAPWKKHALDHAPRFSKLFTEMYYNVRNRVLEGDTQPSFSASMVEKQVKYNLTDKETAWLIATVAAGSETMAGTLAWFMLAMVLYPEVQKKAQAEIDAVVGRSRLPSFDDYDNLVYIRAMVKETLRWHPIDPLGMQHRSEEDDVYEGYFIPGGTICIANVWAINHDPELWGPDPFSYRPERHIGPDGKLAPSPADTKEEGHVTFGFGRRICVGRHLARNSLFLNMACLLWMFNIKPPLDKDGKEVVCSDESVNLGLVVAPLPYEHRFEPRYPDAVEVFEEHKELLGL